MFSIKKRRSADAQYLMFNFMIRINCPKSYNEFLDSYFFNFQKCWFRTFPDSHVWNQI